MSENVEKECCIGCGIDIQFEDPKASGFTPKSIYQKYVDGKSELYCQRCFKLRHYNELQPASLTDDDFLAMLSDLANKEALIVYVIDIFDVYGSLISGLKRFVGDNPILLVANKIDSYPKSMKRSKIKHWITQQVREYGIRPIDTVLVSGHKRTNIDELLDAIHHYRQGKDAYVVGVTNVGKSTLINKIIQSLGEKVDLITTSQFPGTTLGKIEIPFEEGGYLIDTPGIIHRHQLTHYLAQSDVQKLLPQKELQPKTFQLNKGQTIFIGGVARVDFLEGERNSFTFYTPEQIQLHRTKQEKATEFYEKHKGGILTPPTTDSIEIFPELVKVRFHVKRKSDIVIAGLGWVTIQKPATVDIWKPKQVDVIIRESMI